MQRLSQKFIREKNNSSLCGENKKDLSGAKKVIKHIKLQNKPPTSFSTKEKNNKH